MPRRYTYRHTETFHYIAISLGNCSAQYMAILAILFNAELQACAENLYTIAFLRNRLSLSLSCLMVTPYAYQCKLQIYNECIPSRCNNIATLQTIHLLCRVGILHAKYCLQSNMVSFFPRRGTIRTLPVSHTNNIIEHIRSAWMKKS